MIEKLPKNLDYIVRSKHRLSQFFFKLNKKDISAILAAIDKPSLEVLDFEKEFNGNKRIDLIGRDNKGTIFLFEIKTNQKDVKMAIKQILEYRNAFVKDEQAREKIEIHEFNDNNIRLGIIAPDFSDENKSDCKGKNIDIYKLDFSKLVND